MTVTVLNHTRDGIVVHRVGCADITKAKRHYMVNSDWNIDIPAGGDIATTVADDLSAGFGWPETYDPGDPAPWTPSDIRVMPCVRKGTS